jgi:hypothetical protein
MDKYTIEIQTRVILHEVSGIESNTQNIVTTNKDASGTWILDESNDSVPTRDDFIRTINNLVAKAEAVPPPEALPIT